MGSRWKYVSLEKAYEERIRKRCEQRASPSAKHDCGRYQGVCIMATSAFNICESSMTRIIGDINSYISHPGVLSMT